MEDQKYCTLYIVRHGETEMNKAEIVQARIDSPLTDHGRHQVAATAKQLENVHFDVLFSSDLGRAIQSAEILNLERQLIHNTSKLLQERDFGIFDGLEVREYRQRIKQGLERLKVLDEQAKKKFKHHPTMESEDEAASRLLTFLREIAIAYAGKTVLVVSHGSIMRSLLLSLGFAKFDELQYRAVGVPSKDNASYIKLESDGIDFFVKETRGINKYPIS